MSSKSAEYLCHALSIADRSGRGRPYPIALRRSVVAFAEQQRAGGQTVAQIAQGLGLSAITLARWLEPAIASSAMAFFRPVALTPAPQPAHGSSRSGLVVHGPGGVRVEGLDLEGVTRLLRGLA